MSAGDSPRGTPEENQSEELRDFRSFLKNLKSTGCNLLVVGDAPKHLFTQASAQLLGDADITRYRLLAVTDVTPQSVADRLPDYTDTPRALSETTHIINHAEAPRSMTATDDTTAVNLTGIPETQVVDPKLDGLQTALVDGMNDFAGRAGPDGLDPAALRVGIDSLNPLLDHYDERVVRNCLDIVGSHVVEHNAMAHYVLREPFDSQSVQTLAADMDAVIEVQTVDQLVHGHPAQQRWHVPARGIKTGWTPL